MARNVGKQKISLTNMHTRYVKESQFAAAAAVTAVAAAFVLELIKHPVK